MPVKAHNQRTRGRVKAAAPYIIKPFPRMRQVVTDNGRLAGWKNPIYGLIEVDVTQPRQLMRAHKARSGESLSFTAFILSCLGQAVQQNKEVHAYRNWRNQLILFDEVDVGTSIEINAGERTFPLIHVVQAVNKRSLPDIHAEIRAIQADPALSPNWQRWSVVRWFVLLPSFLRNIVYWLVNKNPHLMKQYGGTVGVTSVGMFGPGGGWGIGLPVHTLGITLGGIAEKPGVIDGRIEIREYLCMTISFDHDIVDGTPAARFTKTLKELIEQGYGLCGLSGATC